MDQFDNLIGPLLDREGGYVNNPNDKGGETNFGITIAVARENGYTGPMKTMSRTAATEIYRKKYWTGPWFDRIGQVNAAIAEELFDTGINMGPSVAANFLQQSLNVLNKQGHDWPDIAVDGAIGQATIAALISLNQKRGAEGIIVLLKALNCLQGARYISLAQSRPANEEFIYGWLKNRVGLE